MLNLLEMAFKDQLRTPAWQATIRKIVPGYGTQLASDPRKAYESLSATSEILQLSAPPKWHPSGQDAPGMAMALHSRA